MHTNVISLHGQRPSLLKNAGELLTLELVWVARDAIGELTRRADDGKYDDDKVSELLVELSSRLDSLEQWASGHNLEEPA